MNPAARYCACGHPSGDHLSSRARGLTVKLGPCLIEGCPCTVFTERTSRVCVSCEEREATRPEGYCDLCWPPEVLDAA